MSEGYLYITCTKKLIKEAVISSLSLKRAKPDAHVTLFTNNFKDVPDTHEFDDIQIKAMERQRSLMAGFHGKVQFINETPYDKTLFLDSDTYICEDPSGPFRLLDFFDVLQVPAPGESLAREMEYPYEKIEGTSMYNCGVIFFVKNERTNELFNIWKDFYFNQRPGKTWLKDKKRFREQHPYFQALLRSKCRTHALNSVWNLRAGSHLALKGRVKIIHGRKPVKIRNKKYTTVSFTEEEFENLKKLINVSDEVRLWRSNQRQIIRKGNIYGQTTNE